MCDYYNNVIVIMTSVMYNIIFLYIDICDDYYNNVIVIMTSVMFNVIIIYIDICDV